MGHSQPANQPDRIEAKKDQILTLIEQGHSRRVAAEVVGWSIRTLQRTAAADPHFAWQLAHRKLTWEVTTLQVIQRAARSGRHPAAAVWLKERSIPLDALPNYLRQRLAALGDPPPAPGQKGRDPRP